MTKKLLLTASILLILVSAPLPAAAQERPEGKFFHHVFFWLNEPDNPQARREFLTALRKMKAIPTIEYSFIGTPAGTPREVVDNSWTFYWLVTFEDKDGWKVYNDHPIHNEFRKKAHLWKKVLVYDAIRVD